MVPFKQKIQVFQFIIYSDPFDQDTNVQEVPAHMFPAHLRQPEEAPAKAGQLLSKFRLR
jgi:hypothetical protein